MPNDIPSPVAVFGGTGFLGRRIVKGLLDAGAHVRAVSRHPERAERPFEDARLEARQADIHDAASVSSAVEGAGAAVNAVSLYAESGGTTFHSVHVSGAERLARLCREHGVRRLVQISGIGADPGSGSRYIRARGEGELAAHEAFPDATVIRPSVMFGPDDGFLTTLVQLVRRLPVIPLFGRGETRLQPVHVADVAQAVATTLSSPETAGQTYELGGPRIFTYRELVETVAAALGARRVLLPFPFSGWKALALAGERIPRLPITVNQVELMEIDNVARRRDLEQLGVRPASVESALASILAADGPER